MRGFLKTLVKVPDVAVLPVVNEDEGQLHDNNSKLSPNPAVDFKFVAYALDIEFEGDDVEEEEKI